VQGDDARGYRRTRWRSFTLPSLSLSLSFSLSRLAMRLCVACIHVAQREANSARHFSWRRSRLEQGIMARRRLTFAGRCTARFCSRALALALSLSLSPPFSFPLNFLARLCVCVCVCNCLPFLSLFLFFLLSLYPLPRSIRFFPHRRGETCATAVTRVRYK